MPRHCHSGQSSSGGPILPREPEIIRSLGRGAPSMWLSHGAPKMLGWSLDHTDSPQGSSVPCVPSPHGNCMGQALNLLLLGLWEPHEILNVASGALRGSPSALRAGVQQAEPFSTEPLCVPKESCELPALAARLSNLPDPGNTVLIKILTGGSGISEQLAEQDELCIKQKVLGCHRLLR